MRTPVSVGVVGLGNWGPNLVRVLDELPEADLRWVCDLSSAAALRVKPKLRTARATAHVDDLLDDEGLDAVVLATPPSTHYALAREAIEAGKHVLVETPLALTGEDADDLARRAEQSGRHLMVGHVLLFHPAVRKLKELLDHGHLGDVYYVSSQRLGPPRARRDENVLWDRGAHDVSAIVYLLGDQPIEALADGDSFVQPGVVDAVAASLTFATGIRAHIQLSWLEARRIRRLTVVGSERTAVLEEAEPDRVLMVYDRDPNGQVVGLRVPGDEPLKLECEHFLAAIRSSVDPVAGGREGATVVNVLEALQRSLDREAPGEAVGAHAPRSSRVILFPARTS